MTEQPLKSVIDRVLMAAAHIESPIEFDMSCAIQKNPKFSYRLDQILPDAAGWYVYPQVSIGNYRLDFLLVAKLAGSADEFKMVIECDGKHFHSSPEQREYDSIRDECFTSEGFRVVRFTGSEIRKNADGCVEQIANSIPKKYWVTS